ncbi:50S ribosomal protein L21 [Patescibacteria group bacterium]|nr:50S ribosomal protein L21 [Patescibacteria group bacterium]
MTIAVIKTGGKQYKVNEGKELKIEKIDGAKGDKVNFETLLISDEEGNDLQLGAPILENKTVEAEVVEQARARKIDVIKFKAKVRYRRKAGHRQEYTKVKITSIGGSAPTVKKESVKKTEAKVVEKN